MSTIAYTRSGTGAPLVLLHGLGSSRFAWDPLLDHLTGHADVVAVDLPGFGGSPALPPDVEPAPAALAAAVAGLLDELGLELPHVAGNSLGGWVALELAAIRPVASLTLLSPAGLWRADTPLYARLSLWGTRWITAHAGGALEGLVGTRPGRALVFGQALGHPSRMTAPQARQAIRAAGTAPGFDGAFRATLHRRYRAPQTPLTVPVTVAFGSRDRILLRRQSRRLDELPPQTRVADLPGCGHVPMTDDPVAVARLLTARVLPAPASPGSSARRAPRSAPAR